LNMLEPWAELPPEDAAELKGILGVSTTAVPK
jgi:hypothetical protein